MKSKFFITALFMFSALLLMGQDRLTSEEQAIKKVIEDETHWFNQCNYEKWAECVAQDPMTYFSWTSPFKGEHGVFEAHGWEEVSKSTKEFMANNEPREKDQVKENYSFKVKGNMAFVTFIQDGGKSDETRVLEKVKGQWKILRMDAIARTSFENVHKIYALHRMCGNWEVNMSSLKKEGGGSWKMIGGKMKIDASDIGVKSKEEFRFLDGDGDLQVTDEETVIAVDMGSGKIGYFATTYYPGSNWTFVASGEGDINEDGNLVFTGSKVGSNDKAKGYMKINDDGTLSYAVIVKNEAGEKVYSISYSMNRKFDTPIAATP